HRRQPGRPHLREGPAPRAPGTGYAGPATRHAAGHHGGRLLPRPRPRRYGAPRRRRGTRRHPMSPATAFVAAAPLTETGTGEAVQFWILAPLAVLGALGMVFAAKAVHSAICLAATMISLAVFYIAQDALFLGVVQIVVYTGAVM